jgi:hypothetical protein
MDEETYERLPDKVKTVLYQLTGSDTYLTCEKVRKDLNKIGWDADYGLSAEITDVWKIKEVGMFINLLHHGVKLQRVKVMYVGDKTFEWNGGWANLNELVYNFEKNIYELNL